MYDKQVSPCNVAIVSHTYDNQGLQSHPYSGSIGRKKDRGVSVVILFGEKLGTKHLPQARPRKTPRSRHWWDACALETYPGIKKNRPKHWRQKRSFENRVFQFSACNYIYYCKTVSARPKAENEIPCTRTETNYELKISHKVSLAMDYLKNLESACFHVFILNLGTWMWKLCLFVVVFNFLFHLFFYLFFSIYLYFCVCFSWEWSCFRLYFNVATYVYH